jgi:hypothetical protein
MTDKTLATFKIDPDHWEAFKFKANESGSNASALLKDFISAYLSDRIDLKQDGSIDTLAGLDKKIEAVLDRVMGERLEEVRDELGKLTASLAA